MRSPCRGDAPMDLQMDGSNLPKVINFLKEKRPDYFERWVEHIKSALPEIDNIGVRERPEDRSLYIYITCDSLEIPSWLLSKGTLRLIAHTLIAYLPVKDQIYIIEEPENGLHPLAIESLYQSVSSVYANQVILATYSPAILNLSQAEDILCFSKTESGAVDIILGDEHTKLKGWGKDINLATLYASGVLQ
ncbi:MAG: AAA family ATPase [Candidatus Eremiobacterota bacterium]